MQKGITRSANHLSTNCRLSSTNPTSYGAN